MIQIITYDTSKYKEYSEQKYKISVLGEIQALDDFEICIIDLTNKDLWNYNNDKPISVNCNASAACSAISHGENTDIFLTKIIA